MNEAKLLTFSFLTAQNMPFSSEWFARKSKHLKGHSAFYVSNVMFCQKSFKFVPPPPKKKKNPLNTAGMPIHPLNWTGLKRVFNPTYLAVGNECLTALLFFSQSSHG